MKQFIDSLTPLETGLIVGGAGILIVFIIGIFAFMRGTKDADTRLRQINDPWKDVRVDRQEKEMDQL